MTRSNADLSWTNLRARWLPLLALMVVGGLGCDGDLAAPEDEAIAVVRSAVTSGPAKINAGGPAVSGTSWVVDQQVSGGSQTTTTNNITIPIDVVNAAPTSVYQSARITQSGTTTPFTYTLPGFTAGSNNTVRLHFAEWTATAAGQRVFNVSVNGVAALANFDPFVAAAGRNRALVKEFTGPASTTGQYAITFTPVVGRAVVSGVEIVASGMAQATRVHAGGGAMDGFAADVGFSGGTAVTNNHNVTTASVTHAGPADLYRTGRQSSVSFTYTVPGFVAGSMNNVRLHFAETAKTAVGQRTFHVTINGTRMLSSFDIFMAAGADKAIVKEFRLAADSNGRYVIRFDKVIDSALVSAIEVLRSVPWFTRNNMSASDLQTEINARAAAGYRLTYVSGYAISGFTYYAGVWDLTPGPQTYAAYGMSKNAFETENASRAAAGWTLALVNGYESGGAEAYAAIWTMRSSPPPTLTKVGMDATTYVNENVAQFWTGHVLVHVSGYTFNGQDRYAATWEQRSSPGWYGVHFLSASELQTAIADAQASGYRMVDVSGYNVGGVDRFAAAFEATSGPAAAEYHGVDAPLHTRKLDDLHRQGFTPSVVHAFPAGNVEHYATLWRNDHYSASQLAAIDNLIANKLSTFSLPGMSLAVAKDGRLVFAKAYGPADDVSDAHVNSRYRVASISKPITAAGILRAVEQGRLNYDTKVFGTGSLFGNVYSPPYSAGVTSITIRHLLSHTSGFRGSEDGPIWDSSLTAAQAMAQLLDRPMNALGTFQYCNTNYFVLGRVLEKVYAGSGWQTTDPRTYGFRMAEHVLGPAGIQFMTVGFNDQVNRQQDEVAYLTPGAYTVNVEGMDANGGWVASPMELLKFSTRVDGLSTAPDILAPSTTKRMYDPSITCNPLLPGTGCWGFGWGLDLDSSSQVKHRWHNGGFVGTQSWLGQIGGLHVASATNASGTAHPYFGFTEEVLNTGVSWTAADFFDSPN